MSTNFLDWIKDFSITPRRVIHIGAHLVEERFDYQGSEFEPVIWVESNSNLVSESKILLRDFPNQDIYEGTIANQSGLTIDFYIAGEEESSSSILKPHLIQASHPKVQVTSVEKKITITLDDLLENFGLDYGIPTILVLDIQGSEIDALRGGLKILKSVNYIFSEISLRELYKNILTFDLFVKEVSELGFTLLCAEINETTGWGEGLFIRKVDQIAAGTPRIQVTTNGAAIGTKVRNLFVRLKIPFRYWSWFKR